MRTSLISPRKILDQRTTASTVMVGTPANYSSTQRSISHHQAAAEDYYAQKRGRSDTVTGGMDAIGAMAAALEHIPASNTVARGRIQQVLNQDTDIVLEDIHIAGYLTRMMLVSMDSAGTLDSQLTARIACHTYPLDKLVQDVRRHPMVNAKARVAVSSGHWLTFTTIPLILRPDNNPYLCIDNGEIPYVPLGAMTLCIDLKSGETYIYPASRRAKTRAGYGCRVASHPHELSRHSPCLGDFGPPLAEALEQGDLMMALDIIQAFLKQAATQDLAGKNWLAWVIDPQYYSRGSYDKYKPLYAREAGGYVQYRTSPDGTIRRIVTTPSSPVQMLPGINPARNKWTFWDGRSIPQTGDIVMLDGHAKYLAWKDDRLFSCSTCHPTDPEFASRMGEVNADQDILPIPGDMQFHYYSQLLVSDNSSPPLQWAWNLWDHLTPQAETYNPRLIDCTGTWSVRGRVKLMGPMSREYDIAPGECLEADALSGWEDGLVSVTPTETAFPQAALIPYEYVTDNDNDDVRIGAIHDGEMVATYTTDKQKVFTITRLPWLTEVVSSEIPRWHMKLPHGISEPGIVKFIGVCRNMEATCDTVRMRGIFRSWVRKWHQAHWCEQDFTPFMWAVYQRELALIEVEKQQALDDARANGPQYTPGAVAHVTTPNMFNAAANNAVRVDFRDGEYVVVHAAQTY